MSDITLNDITPDQLIGAVRKVILDRGPDYVYPTRQCSYGGPDEGLPTPRCVFGEALVGVLGVRYNPAWEGWSIAALLAGNHAIPAHVIEAARYIQQNQDWGAAYGDIIASGSPFEAEV